MQITTERARTVAVLGPTNTGKTYLALERMLGHANGMIGFPLRLLARENYDRAVALKGARQVALITGEEKIIPPYAKYFFCTVESMPLAKKVEFLAVDEIQMCADPDRGHIFTNRLLHARGVEETMFMGAESIRPFLKSLLEEADFITRPRFSTLTYTGARKIARLPTRSAIVGFAAADVYTIAELIRRQRGGAAIVMGALSPRTRNAQVEMFQNGDVDYLVATDAIGMGLNMDVDHIAFAALEKFDGQRRRQLWPEELAQIAGRAGRHMSDGSFGVTADAGDIPPNIAAQIEEHKFAPIKNIHWRNDVLDFSTPENLIRSLGQQPKRPGLVKMRQAADEQLLTELLRDTDIQSRAQDEDQLHLLWDVCQIPDFRNITTGGHVKLLNQIYSALCDDGGLANEWVGRQVSRIDNTDGGIESLLDRIANIRIWTYISHRADWLAEPGHWQDHTRDIENRLSDALHDRLTQRFVDQRTAVLVKRLQDKEQLRASVSGDGEVLVEGHFVGRLEGFKFSADRTDSELAGKAVTTAAFKALAGEVRRRAAMLATAPAEEFELKPDGRICWRNSTVARLKPSSDALFPAILITTSELLETLDKETIETRLQIWLKEHIGRHLRPLFKARETELTGAMRGLVFQLIEGFGAIDRIEAYKQLKALEKKDYGSLHRLGVKLGRRDIFIPALLRPKPAGLCALLWAIKAGADPIPEPPPPGRVSLPAKDNSPEGFMAAAGYRRIGPLMVRADILERLIGMIRKRAAHGAFIIDAELLNLAGCGAEDFEPLLSDLGYTRKKVEGRVEFVAAKHQKKKTNHANKRTGKKPPGTKKIAIDPNSPFAKLKELVIT